MKRQTAFEQNLRLLARRLDQGYPLTPELKAAIADVVASAARALRAEREVVSGLVSKEES